MAPKAHAYHDDSMAHVEVRSCLKYKSAWPSPSMAPLQNSQILPSGASTGTGRKPLNGEALTRKGSLQPAPG